MKLKYTLALSATIAVSVCAFAAEQSWDKRIPAGYSLDKEVRGDLNEDAKDDYVLVIKGTDRRGIMIFFSKGKDYQLVLENRNCLDSGEVEIKKGNMLITHGNKKYTFRYKNSEFELIGYDINESSPKKETSINIPLKKKFVKECSEDKKCKETWTNVAFIESILLRRIDKLDEFNIDNYTEAARIFTDSRDNKKYKTVKIGKQTWMAENLNHQMQTGNSWCYENNASNCEKYGRLYDISTAKKACPAEWHLPSRDEWDGLAQAVGGSGERSEDGTISWRGAGLTLRYKNGWNENVGTDGYGFSALPGGRFYDKKLFDNAGSNSYWWTATDREDGCTYYRYMFDKWDRVYEGCYNDSMGFSVRCVKD